MSPKLSIVIVTYNVSGLVVKCIQSIYRHERNIAFEILVVDNNSSDDTAVKLKSQFSRIEGFHLICNSKNIGFARSCNQLIDKASGKYVLFLNPDTEIIDPNSLYNIFQFMESNRSIGICGPRIVFGDGKLQLSCGRKPTLQTTFFEVFSLPKYMPRLLKGYRYADWNHSETRKVDWVSGACLMIRKNLLNELGGFDEQMLFYAEDVDLCLRAKLLGFEVAYCPIATIIHYEGQSSRKTRTTAVIAGYKSKLHFFKKYNGLNAARILKLSFIISSLGKIGILTILTLVRPKTFYRILESYCVALSYIWAYRIE